MNLSILRSLSRIQKSSTRNRPFFLVDFLPWTPWAPWIPGHRGFCRRSARRWSSALRRSPPEPGTAGGQATAAARRRSVGRFAKRNLVRNGQEKAVVLVGESLIWCSLLWVLCVYFHVVAKFLYTDRCYPLLVVPNPNCVVGLNPVFLGCVCKGLNWQTRYSHNTA